MLKRSDPPTWKRPGRATGKATPEHARRHNRGLVLLELFRGGPQSRADLARATHLSRVTMSDLVADLMAEGLVEELGRLDEQGPGKPATLVGVVPDARHVICLDLSDEDELRGAVVNLAGKVLHRSSVRRRGRTGDNAVDVVIDLAADLLTATEQTVLGIGVGSPGIVDDDGVVVEAARLQWHGVPLGARLADRLP